MRSCKKELSVEAVGAIVVTAAVALILVAALLVPTLFRMGARSRLQKLSNHDSGATCDEVVATIQAGNPGYEIIIVFDKNGEKLIEYTEFEEHAVGLPDEALRLLRSFEGLTHVHNHPETDTGHSDNDLFMPLKVGLERSIESLVVIGTKRVFRMDCAGRDWPDWRQIAGYFQNLMNNYDETKDPIWMETIVVDGQEAGYFTDAFLTRFASDFGYNLEITDPSVSQSKSPLYGAVLTSVDLGGVGWLGAA